MNTDPAIARTDAGGVEVGLNVAALFGVSAILAAALILQLSRNELPCPLCLLQRIALCLIGAGLIYNLKFGPRARGYAMILLAAAAGGIVAVRQILLHIAPGDPGYGSPVLGLHYYTWAAIVFAAAIAATGIMLLFDRALAVRETPRPLSMPARVAAGLAVAITIVNVASTLLECGFKACPDNPVAYELL
jgi:disulfide bond formation protein DsbB